MIKEKIQMQLRKGLSLFLAGMIAAQIVACGSQESGGSGTSAPDSSSDITEFESTAPKAPDLPEVDMENKVFNFLT